MFSHFDFNYHLFAGLAEFLQYFLEIFSGLRYESRIIWKMEIKNFLLLILSPKSSFISQKIYSFMDMNGLWHIWSLCFTLRCKRFCPLTMYSLPSNLVYVCLDFDIAEHGKCKYEFTESSTFAKSTNFMVKFLVIFICFFYQLSEQLRGRVHIIDFLLSPYLFVW